MKILVTGGAGFIGSHLCQALLQNGHRVAVVDDLNDFYPRHWKVRNLAESRQYGDLVFEEMDICDSPRLMNFVQGMQPEAVVHLAGRAGVRSSVQNPELYERVNVGGTVALLEACRAVQARKFVFASSSSVYGFTNQLPFAEEDRTMRPASPYAASKLAGEAFANCYSHLYGMQVVCLRFFTVFGPRQRPDLAIRKFIKHIVAGMPIPVYGDGSTSRDYTYVGDIVNGICAALQLDAPFEILNLGNSHPVGLLELIQILEQELNLKAKIEFLPMQAGDVPVTFADISKAQRLLGYSPATPFRLGIQECIRWHFSLPRALMTAVA